MCTHPPTSSTKAKVKNVLYLPVGEASGTKICGIRVWVTMCRVGGGTRVPVRRGWVGI